MVLTPMRLIPKPPVVSTFAFFFQIGDWSSSTDYFIITGILNVFWPIGSYDFLTDGGYGIEGRTLLINPYISSIPSLIFYVESSSLLLPDFYIEFLSLFYSFFESTLPSFNKFAPIILS